MPALPVGVQGDMDPRPECVLCPVSAQLRRMNLTTPLQLVEQVEWSFTYRHCRPEKVCHGVSLV